ncbi:hypothetical protein EB822_10735 [Flavobacteriaceae bacterium PRS1]|nr:hypothetical protein EB822_10735 [Flavobacteriaceae bacterium PRS1]
MLVKRMKIAVFACANGLGHVRRIIAISAFMLKNGFQGQLDAFMPLTHIQALKDWEECKYFVKHPLVKIIDFEYPLKYKRKTQTLFDQDWMNISLPDLSHYDVVWSDNIVQVLETRKDAILTGSFLWHEVFDEQSNKNGLKSFVEDQRKLLHTVKPTMVGNEYFSTPEVKLKTNFIPVGLYRYSLLFQEKKDRGILLSCGLGGEEEALTKKAIHQIIEDNIIPPDILFVEPRILPKKYPNWIKKADFSDKMFQYCAAVCIRPGMGTISDALVSRNRIFAFTNDNSFEMSHNCRVLENLNVGKQCVSPYDAYLEALKYLESPKQLNNQLLRTSHLRTDGVFATAIAITK